MVGAGGGSLQVSVLISLSLGAFPKPSSSVRCTGVPGLSLHPGVKVMFAGVEEPLPPPSRDGSFY